MSDDPAGSRHTDESPVVKDATEARQGRYGVRVFYVLAGGLVLAAIVLVLLVGFTGVSAPPPSIGADPVGPSSGGGGIPEPSRLDVPPPPSPAPAQ